MRWKKADCYTAPALEVKVEMQIIMLPSLKGLCNNHIILFQSISNLHCYSFSNDTSLFTFEIDHLKNYLQSD